MGETSLEDVVEFDIGESLNAKKIYRRAKIKEIKNWEICNAKRNEHDNVTSVNYYVH